MKCPKCGEKGIFDDTSFCGLCEEQYRQEQAEEEHQRKERRRQMVLTHADDCDCLLCRTVFGSV